MTPPTIDALIAYVRAKCRPNQIDGRLLSHIDALQAEIAELRAITPAPDARHADT